jgi:hypothetical protein
MLYVERATQVVLHVQRVHLHVHHVLMDIIYKQTHVSNAQIIVLNVHQVQHVQVVILHLH